LATSDNEVDLAVSLLECTIGVALFGRWRRGPLLPVAVLVIVVVLATSIIASVVVTIIMVIIAMIAPAVVMPVVAIIVTVVVMSVTAAVVEAIIASIPMLYILSHILGSERPSYFSIAGLKYFGYLIVRRCHEKVGKLLTALRLADGA
jgi:hypothetical protein